MTSFRRYNVDVATTPRRRLRPRLCNDVDVVLTSRDKDEVERERERESKFLTTHQHILGYTVSFTLYMIFTRWIADNLK